jgi:predicted MPP superfamily phosphohydrolase
METTRDWFTPGGRLRRGEPDVLDLALHAVRRLAELTGTLPWLSRSALAVRRHTVELELAGLPPPFDGYTILHVTDPHFDSLAGLERAIPAACRGVAADLLAFTGDFRAADRGGFREREVLRPLERIVGSVAPRDGAVAVLGNHDTEEMLEPLEEQLGIRVLVNEAVGLERERSRIEIVGLDDPHRFYSASTAAFLEELSAAPEACRIFLVHTPELAAAAAERGGKLYLCGHTHGGQICLPGGRPVVRPLHTARAHAAGLWQRGAMHGYTSAGCGVSGNLPIRLFSRGEVTLFRLRAPASAARTEQLVI